ncbi:hypothetical protein HK102_006180 [Quaeritorhiza haematococci]|nr:hypothetical protein HK102_006180 [Quaeritorhiza haematococci]
MTKMMAKKYLAAGFVVFPVGLSYNEEKSAKEKKVKKDLAPEPGFTKLTLKTAKRLSFTRNAIGLLTGFGVMAVDIDNMDLWDHVLSELGETEPKTCKSISQSGGRHLLFKVNPELERLRKHGVFGFKKLGRKDFDVLGKGDFLLVPPSSFLTPLEKREYAFVEGYLLLNNPEKLIEAPEWLLQVLTHGSVPHNRVRGTFLRQDLAKKAAEKKERERVEKEEEEEEEAVKEQEEQEQGQKRKGGDSGEGTRLKRGRSNSIDGLTAAEEAFIALDAEDRLKEVKKHINKLNANRAVDRQSWIEVGMAIHHATDGQGMELWDEFSRRAGPYDRRTLEYQWDLFKNGSGITIGSLIHWAKEDAKDAQEEKKRLKAEEAKMKSDEALRREAVKFGVNHTGGEGVFEGWDAEKSLAVIKNMMHHPDHHVECVFSRDGAFQRCLECAWRNPFAGKLMIPQTKYPALHQQFFQITINNTVNNYNNKETNVAWNKFKEDGLKIVSDPETNDLLLAGLSGTNQRVAELAYHIYGSRFAIVPGGCWFHFNGVVWEQDKDRHEIKLCLKSDAFLGMFTDAKAAFANTANDVNDRKRKVAHIQNVINKLESAAFKNAVVDELGPLVATKTKKLKFIDKLDKNRDLLALSNGVFDLKNDRFCAAEPEDYLTLTVGYNFEAKRDPEIEARVHDFFDKVFPDPKVKEYTLKFLASCTLHTTHTPQVLSKCIKYYTTVWWHVSLLFLLLQQCPPNHA